MFQVSCNRVSSNYSKSPFIECSTSFNYKLIELSAPEDLNYNEPRLIDFNGTCLVPSTAHSLVSTATHLTEIIMLLVVVTRRDIPRLTNQKQVCGQLTPVVPLFSLVQPLPVEMYKVMFNTSAH